MVESPSHIHAVFGGTAMLFFGFTRAGTALAQSVFFERPVALPIDGCELVDVGCWLEP